MEQKITVLIVEDNLDDYLLLKGNLDARAEPFEIVLLHEDRLEGALAAAGSTPIDVAIIDLHLPDSNGLDTFVAFNKRYPLVPTIIMTGSKDQEMALEGLSKGAQDYLFKSELLTPTAIIRGIRYAIERQRLTTDLRIALNHVMQLQGLLPICSICKKIRDDQGYWKNVEAYMEQYLDVSFSHSLCPGCVQKYYSEFVQDYTGKRPSERKP